jgi:hypothetical protein
MKKYSFLQESIGRNLINASKYDSKKNVVQSIVNKYPNPQSLSQALFNMSKYEQLNPKLSEQINKMAITCQNIHPNNYISFVKKIAGFSGLWSQITKYILYGTGIGAVAYLVKRNIPTPTDNNT